MALSNRSAREFLKLLLKQTEGLVSSGPLGKFVCFEILSSVSALDYVLEEVEKEFKKVEKKTHKQEGRRKIQN